MRNTVRVSVKDALKRKELSAMAVLLDATVLDLAREKTGYRSDERLAAQIGVSGLTVRKWRKGEATPLLESLVRLQNITGLPLDAMVYKAEDAA